MDDEQIRREYLCNEIMAVLEDTTNAGFYRRVVECVPEQLIYKALAEIRADLPEEIGNPKAYFVAAMQKAASIASVENTN